MGSFNVSCSVSKLSISSGDHVVYIPLTRNKYFKFGNENDHMKNFFCYPQDIFIPITLPIFGKYNDYGSLENIERDENVKYIEEKLNCGIIVIIEGRPSNIIDAGMFIHREIWDLLINNQIDEWNNKECLKSDIEEEWEKYKKILIKENQEDKIYSDIKYERLEYFSFNSFSPFIELRRFYKDECFINDNFKNLFINLILFHISLMNVNGMYIPNQNGPQLGNYYMQKKLYEKSLEITNKNIKLMED